MYTEPDASGNFLAARPELVPSTVPSVSSGERAIFSRDRAVIILLLLSSHWDSCAFSPPKGRMANVATEKRREGRKRRKVRDEGAVGRRLHIGTGAPCGDSEAVTPKGSEV